MAHGQAGGAAKVLSRVADLHRRHVAELVDFPVQETGKPIGQARDEVTLPAPIFDR